MTAMMAWPVVLAPSQQVYGHQIVGRHPDVHEAIATMAGPLAGAARLHPLTSLPGWLLARIVSPVTAYNLVVLLTFPLAAMAAYGLARYLSDSHAAALVAGLVYAFAPAHLSQAAYHPYVAQTQWLPLYMLALIALVDRATVARALLLVLATGGLVFSNGYAGVVGALTAPLVLTAFWIIRPDADRNLWPLVWPAVVVGVVSLAGSAFVLAERSTPEAVQALDHGIVDIGLYRAQWWAYFTPPVDHPVLGRFASAVFDRHGVNLELLELQIYLGYAFLVLAVVAVVSTLWRWEPQRRYLLAVAAVAIGAALISLGPASGSCERFSIAPACLLFRVVPLFRAYARFGLVVNLAVSIAAGAGAALLMRGSRAGQAMATALLTFGVFEFWPLPARAHDVLPTSGHRWLASEPAAARILDCYPANRADMRLSWVMGRALDHLSPSVPSCADPDLGTRLTASGYSHVIVRGGQVSSKLLTPLPTGIEQVRAFPDATVYAVAATLPPVVTVEATGFFGYEHDGDDWWRWMGPEGRWRIRNTTSAPRRVTLALDLVSYATVRTLSVVLDDAPAATLKIATARSQHVLGPWTLAPGDHTLALSSDGAGIRPAELDDSSDRRPLTVAFRNPRWIDAP
jgi:hypothetical protein